MDLDVMVSDKTLNATSNIKLADSRSNLNEDASLGVLRKSALRGFNAVGIE
jgi:hypothetical protein